MVEPRLTAAEAASAIVALINSRPTSPWLGEIQAVIERVNADVEFAGSSMLAVKLRAMMPPLRRSIMDECDATTGPAAHRAAVNHTQDLNARFYPLVQQLWAMPPVTLDDLVIRAEIAQFEARDWPAPYHHLPMLSDATLGGGADIELRQLAIAVLQMGGHRYAV
jgi:hypothetical protein